MIRRLWSPYQCLKSINAKRILGHLEYPAKVKPSMEKLEISLTPDLVKRIDYIVELLGLESREEFLMAATRRLLDHYSMISKSIPRTT